MDVLFGLHDIRKTYPAPVVAIGVFDGIHRGHQQLIREAVDKARALKGTAMVMTFYPHPVHVLRPDVYLPLIVSLPYRLHLLAEMGIDACWVIRFTKRFSRLSPEQFIKNYLMAKVIPREIVIGDDFRFGQDRSGSLSDFQKAARRYGFGVRIVPTTRGGRKSVCSTRIRNLIAQGKITPAARLLGRPVSLSGRVVHGDTRGESLGYPTANIIPPEAVILPTGVFIVMIHCRGRRYRGIANIGSRPSFKRTGQVNVEAHIFNFHRDLYGEEISVDLLKKIRDEKQFWAQDELVKQIRRDEARARRWFQALRKKSPGKIHLKRRHD